MIKIQKRDMDAKGEVTLVFGKQVCTAPNAVSDSLVDVWWNLLFRIPMCREKAEI